MEIYFLYFLFFFLLLLMYLLSIYYPRKSSSLSPNEKMVQYVRETMREKFNEICIFFLFYTPPPSPFGLVRCIVIGQEGKDSGWKDRKRKDFEETYEVAPGRRRSPFWQHTRRSPRDARYRAREVEVDQLASRTYPSIWKSAEFLAGLYLSCLELVSSPTCSKFVP